MNRTLATRVLIAEDEPSIVTSIDFLMRKCGFETRLARDGAEALEAVADFRPDVVILDLMLPRVSGLDVCRRIRARADWEAVRVLMLTARGSGTDMERGLATGADDYVVKPFSTQDLVQRVKRLLPP
jgi:DNA-binding response OmpR family regulator